MSDFVLPNTPIQPGAVREIDTLMARISQALEVEPVGTHYSPSYNISPEVSVTGGYVPTVRRYTIKEGEKLVIPYRGSDGASSIGRDKFLEGDVTEADLIAANANIPYLMSTGYIIENGYMRL